MIGDTGEPITRPSVCSYRFPLNWKYVDFRQNRKRLTTSFAGMEVGSSRVSSDKSRHSVILIAASTGTLVTRDTTSNETMISLRVNLRSLDLPTLLRDVPY